MAQTIGSSKPLQHESTKNGLATGITYNAEKNPLYCQSCIKGKQSRRPFPNNKNKGVAKNKLDLIHLDLVGPIEVASWSGSKYMLTFIDDHTSKIFSYFLKSKDEVPDVFLGFVCLLKTRASKKLRFFEQTIAANIVMID